ncbi:hypothetical protein [Paenibacillus bovis]|uniref:P/Homo B domain-containing protein n=1 Tax=Paenibacillus bovis TaxID=1616788 RepID=A0A172ZFI9_9BACL|nr:hypothetical protein [Paenibacillus bovis]ANF96142.1 hypothetical protein AR543_09125 [Paenibacillus bovis]
MKRKRLVLFFSCIVIAMLILLISLTNHKATMPEPTAAVTTQPVQPDSYPNKQENKQIHKTIREITDESTARFDGEYMHTFTLDAVEGTVSQILLVHMRNKGRTSFTYQLFDPAGDECKRGTLAPGKQQTVQYTWINEQAGDWTMKISNINGSPGSYSYSVQNRS